MIDKERARTGGSVRLRLLISALMGVFFIMSACGKGTAQDAQTSPDAGEVVLVSATPLPTATPVPTATPTATPTPSPTPTATPQGYLCAAYEDKFTDKGHQQLTAMSFTGASVSITVTTYQDDSNNYCDGPLVYHVADVYLHDLSCLRGGFRKNTPQKCYTADIEDIAAEYNALLAINGDFINYRSIGLCVRNGETIYKSKDADRDVCVIYRDGSMETFTNYTVADILAADPWQVLCFGPELLDSEGKAKTKFNSDVKSSNPRSVIGYYEPGHYCFVTVDGRRSTYSVGLNMKSLSRLMEDLGCVRAYNLDGGGSAQLYFNGQLISVPPNRRQRKLNDVLYITATPVGDAIASEESQD